MPNIPNVLAERYATAAMADIWSPEGKVVLEREFWIAVMKAQAELGLDIPAADIASYEKVKDQVDLDSIMARERVTRHDVKARIEEFCDLAGCEHIHKGMTSRDLTENVEQLQVYRALGVIRDKAVAALAAVGRRAEEWGELYISARTHNVAAQTTTYGKRVAMFGEELLGAFGRLEEVLASYPSRGLKGAVGTQLDQLALFEGDAAKVAELETKVVAHLGIPQKASNVGQVYPRSLDLRVVSVLTELCSAPSSFCRTLRLMAGHELAGEGFAKGQVGSSAMPHKMNARSCERVNGFHTLLKGYLTMAGGLAGDQWNEGDVSCSVVRRVMLPDAFFAADGLLETFLTILGQMEVYPDVIAKENDRYLPFLTTTTFLMEAVKAGAGREAAHEAIKEHAVAALRALRSGEAKENDLLARLADDDRLGIPRQRLDELLAAAETKAGAATEQIREFLASVGSVNSAYADAAAYTPGSIL
jgi:adenylosuccinate lyase